MTFNRPEPSITLRRAAVEYADKKIPKGEQPSAEFFWNDDDALILTKNRAVNLYETDDGLQVKERFFDQSSTWEYVD